MKLKLDRKKFLDALTLVSQACDSHMTLPILGNVKLLAAPNALILTTTDLDNFLSKKIESEVTESGAVTIPARMLRDFVNRVDSSTIELAQEENEVWVTGGDSQAVFGILPAEDFPVAHKVTGATTLTCSSVDLTTALTKVAHSMSQDPTRYALQGVNFAANGDSQIRLAATSGARLSVFESELKSPRAFDCIISERAVRFILSIFSETQDIEISMSESVIKISNDSNAICSKLIEGKFPNYTQVIPAKSDIAFTCSRADLIRAIETARIFVEPPQIAVKLFGKKKFVEISSPGEKSRVNLLGGELAGQPTFSIHFNYRYMLDALKVIEGDTVRIQVADEMTPMLIEEGPLREVISPVRVG